MSQETLFALVSFAFVSSITPGPNNLMLMASGTNFGFARTIPHMVGVSIGFTLMIVLLGLGVWQAFRLIPYADLALKAVSAVYLVYLAWKVANSAPPVMSGEEPAHGARPFTFMQAALFQWVNPKAWTMGLIAIGAYLSPQNPSASLTIIALAFCLVNLPCIMSWAMMGAQLRRLLRSPLRLRIFNVTAALLLVASLWPILTSTLGEAH